MLTDKKKERITEITQRLLKLSDSDLETFASALRFFCPSDTQCSDCPLYAGFSDRFPLVPCLAVQADLELEKRGLKVTYVE